MPKTDIIQERIFECLEKFNFRLVANVIQDWELTEEEESTPEGLRELAIAMLSDAYNEVENSNDDHVLLISSRLQASCYHNEDGFDFCLEFILSSSLSKPLE